MRQRRRRTFLKAAGLGAAAIAMHGRSILGAESRRVVMGIIGTGGMGSSHVRLLSKRDDVEVAYVCDVDEKRLAAASGDVHSASGKAPKAVKDLRKVLDDPAVEAVLIATPDHWHAPASILALEAGKHVYVEKPCSHNIREGRLMVEAARKAGKSLQVGTQSRSTPVIREAIERIRSGEIGEVLVAKAWNSQLRSSIGKTQPGEPPANLDFDLWLGPAPSVPFRSNMLHSIWRWWHDFGCGDIGNDGVHDIDVACWGLDVNGHPSRVACLGGKYFFDDDQQFPDTQYAVFEYEPEGGSGRKKQLIFEQRIWSPYVQEGYENGAAFYGTKGVLVMGHSFGWKLYGTGQKLILEKTGSPDLPAHHTNFLASVRGEAKKLNADAMAGHLSATIVHLANIAARVGRVLHFDPGTEEITGDSEAGPMVRRKYREDHWAVPKGV
ncbi:MAG TPA: Gfo/Idh/MocA family oxidoreductase [Planctomycetota bacterium]|nr:Gfo/Idh/MocA family oxidoreductase [Planctomycetota bacterium]